MTKEKQIPITLVTGFSDRLKSTLIKEMKLQIKSKVILFRDPRIVNRDISKECFIQENIPTEVVQDLELFTIKDLLSTIKVWNTKQIDQIIINLDKLSNVHLLSQFSNVEEDDWLISKHIHVVDAVNFWFQYSSNEYIYQYPNEEEINESSIGELLITPLELADTILLGGIDKINKERLSELQWFLNKLNPLAKVMTTNDLKTNDSLYRETNNRTNHTSQQLYTYQLQHFEQKKPLMLIGEYGIDTYIYRSPFPISMKNLKHFFTKLPEGLLRTKALCYIPYENKTYYISQIGPTIEVLSEKQSYYEPSSKVLSEFLFIGDHLNPHIIEKQLEKCLMKDDCFPTAEISR
ncbi:GTP-binding protein [Evansella sp. AB-rgal1]|uniref:GTP-binding protein n=1 Tax=Evansella sp. AB-rgal1 TaxID=3242696 RepID=UPI00359DD670